MSLTPDVINELGVSGLTPPVVSDWLDSLDPAERQRQQTLAGDYVEAIMYGLGVRLGMEPKLFERMHIITHTALLTMLYEAAGHRLETPPGWTPAPLPYRPDPAL